MLEQLVEAGIEEICLIIGEDEQADFDRFFAPLPEEQREKLPENKRKYEHLITGLLERVTYVYQKERLGFGHAVWLAKQFTDGEPVLLLLGDFLYRSNLEVNCCRQVIDAYKECGCTLVIITEVLLNQVVQYYATFGQYVLTPEVFEELERQIRGSGKPSEGKEYGLTAALDTVREKYGMYAFLPDGESFDIGLPDAYRETMRRFGRPDNE